MFLQQLTVTDFTAVYRPFCNTVTDCPTKLEHFHMLRTETHTQHKWKNILPGVAERSWVSQ